MWSLAIEEQFYILFPVVLFLFFKIIRRHLFSILLALFSISVYLNSTEQGYDKFYNLEFRAWELLLGALIMIISSNIRFEKIEILGLFLIVFSIYYFDNNWIIQIEPKIICLVGVSLILLSNYEESVLSRISKFNLVRRVGFSSYSLYLLHQPFFAYYRIVEEKKEFFNVALNFLNLIYFKSFLFFL